MIWECLVELHFKDFMISQPVFFSGKNLNEMLLLSIENMNKAELFY